MCVCVCLLSLYPVSRALNQNKYMHYLDCKSGNYVCHCSCHIRALMLNKRPGSEPYLTLCWLCACMIYLHRAEKVDSARFLWYNYMLPSSLLYTTSIQCIPYVPWSLYLKRHSGLGMQSRWNTFVYNWQESCRKLEMWLSSHLPARTSRKVKNEYKHIWNSLFSLQYSHQWTINTRPSPWHS